MAADGLHHLLLIDDVTRAIGAGNQCPDDTPALSKRLFGLKLKFGSVSRPWLCSKRLREWKHSVSQKRPLAENQVRRPADR